MNRKKKFEHHKFTVGLYVEEFNATVVRIEKSSDKPARDGIVLKRHCCESQEEKYIASTLRQYLNGTKKRKYLELCKRCFNQKAVQTRKQAREHKPEAFTHGPGWPVPLEGIASTYYGDTR